MQTSFSLIAAEVRLPARLRSSFEGLKDFFQCRQRTKLTAAQRKAGNERINAFVETLS